MKALSHKGIKRFLLVALSIGAMIAGGAFWTHPGEAGSIEAAVQRVNPAEVCMVNDTVMGKAQIPVAFEGKTYYGCCAGCVEAIKTDRTVRYSTDPVTGVEVDKAASFIIMGSNGEALYFESAETARKFVTSFKQ